MMILHKVKLGNLAIGLNIVAEDQEETNLLDCLSELRPQRGVFFEQGRGSLYLCPRIPWENVQKLPPDSVSPAKGS